MAVRTVIAACVALSTCTSVALAGGNAHVSGTVLVALNPQPEPPGATERKGGSVALNPQPEPPGIVSRQITLVEGHVKNRGDRVALNPQPEPPGYPIIDARRLLPPGPCVGLVIRVEAPNAAPVTANGTDIGHGKCGFDVVVPGASSGTVAKVTISRRR